MVIMEGNAIMEQLCSGEHERKLLRMHLSGMPPSAIAAETGASADYVRQTITSLWMRDRERCAANRRSARNGDAE